MRVLTAVMLVSICLAASLTGSAASSSAGVELRDVTLAGKVHLLAGFDSPYAYALSSSRRQFAYVPFQTANTPAHELRISDLRGRDPVVVHAPGPIFSVSWAPAGRPIALGVGSTPIRPGGIWLVEPDGTGLHRVADGDSGLAWSPDSRKLAIDRRVRGSFSSTISVLTVATGAVREVADGYGPSWSPNGRSLLYSWSDEIAHKPDEIRLVSAEGGTPRMLANGWAPTWSPDGRRIAFIHQTDTTPAGLWVMASFGGPTRLLARRAGEAMWLPNSRRIAFTQRHRSASCGYRTTVSIVRAGGGKASRVLAAKSSVEPLAWTGRRPRLLYLKSAC